MRLVPALLAVFLAIPVSAEITTVILVRHAEKASDDADPPLSGRGAARANELARALASTPIDAIYTTQYLRTQQTAQPVAAAAKVEAKVFAAGKTYASDLAAHIRANHHGQTVLVAGHSNTTFDVARALGVTNVPKIDDPQYDYLFIVTLAGDDEKIVILRYGEPTP